MRQVVLPEPTNSLRVFLAESLPFQARHVIISASSVTNAWSSWSAYSKCFDANDGNGKREHSQRFCFRKDLNLCPGANWAGTEKRSRPCSAKPATGSGK